MKRALLSVSDKSNIVEFARGLIENEFEIISTGGTFKTLKTQGIAVKTIEEITDFPEILDGRVKTLHPKIHGGLLAVRDNQIHQKQMKLHDIDYIDLVCVNLYPFKETISKNDVTFEEAIENIDIGGPSMLRSSAKNHQDVTVVVDYNDYKIVLAEIKEFGNTLVETRKKLAAKVFRYTAAYDAIIANYLTKEEFPEKLTITYELHNKLRYGENPHQNAAFYESCLVKPYSLTSAKQLHGKELSYNNIQDANTALQIVREFQCPVVVALKHMNPCGIGLGKDIYNAWQKAYESDPTSIFGGIIATNQIIDCKCAEEMAKIFLEIIIAPNFSKEAFDILSLKRNIRLITLDMTDNVTLEKKHVSINGGLLVQDFDNQTLKEITVPTERKPTDEEMEQLTFAWIAVKHVKSNAIVIAKDNMTIGIGAGQMNRIGAAKIAIEQAGFKSNGAVMASDAFFPMSDTVELASEAGITAIIQPGGSIKDQDSIDICDKYGIAMVFTGIRHFKH